MPTITALERARGRRGWRDVYLDGELAGSLPAKACREAGLAVGAELPPGELARLRDVAHREEAVDRALRYLSHRPRSRSEMERHLRRKGYVQAAVEGAVARCTELGYLDDRAFAAAYARDRIRLRPRAAALLISELGKRGVSYGDARAGVERAFEQEGVTETDLLRRAAEKRWRVLRGRDPEEIRRKLQGYLSRRGFAGAEVFEVVDGLVESSEGGDRPGRRRG